MGSCVLDPLNQIPPDKFHTPQYLDLPQKLWEYMKSEVDKSGDEEACGLVAGRWGSPAYSGELIVPVTNQLHSPARYQMDPQEQMDALLNIEKSGMDLVAIYHSHPHGPAIPSPTDIAEAYYPESIMLIWSHQDIEWSCRGFFVRLGEVQEVAIRRTGRNTD